jgi:hypothetical protein
VNGDFAAVGVFQAIKQAQQRRFPAPLRPIMPKISP